MFWLQENLILMKKMSKKCSTDKSFIRKRNTTYKIGTLIRTLVNMRLIECQNLEVPTALIWSHPFNEEFGIHHEAKNMLCHILGHLLISKQCLLNTTQQVRFWKRKFGSDTETWLQSNTKQDPGQYRVNGMSKSGDIYPPCPPRFRQPWHDLIHLTRSSASIMKLKTSCVTFLDIFSSVTTTQQVRSWIFLTLEILGFGLTFWFAFACPIDCTKILRFYRCFYFLVVWTSITHSLTSWKVKT